MPTLVYIMQGYYIKGVKNSVGKGKPCGASATRARYLMCGVPGETRKLARFQTVERAGRSYQWSGREQHYASDDQSSPQNTAGAMRDRWLWQKHLRRPVFYSDCYRLIRLLPHACLRRRKQSAGQS